MNLTARPDFHVVDESDDWIVVDKAAPLLIHPANCKPEPTLLGGVEALCSFELANGGTLGIVNRLDRETSGLVLIAKHTKAARALGMSFERREAQKEYLAVVHGWPAQQNWTCGEPLCRESEVRKSNIWVRQIVHPLGKPSFTEFTVVRTFCKDCVKYALVRCRPLTGRMHQIRVHLAFGGHPIAGDKLYTNEGHEYLEWMEFGWTEALSRKLPIARLALHSEMLTVPWNRTEISWRTKFPEDFAEFLGSKNNRGRAEVALWRTDFNQPTYAAAD